MKKNTGISYNLKKLLEKQDRQLPIKMCIYTRLVGAGGALDAVAPPDFDILVNPISIRRAR